VNANGILLVDKAASFPSFHLVHLLRKRLKVAKIGHAGTLDPFATGVMVMLIGSQYTRLSESYLTKDKSYRGTLHLGVTTETYDPEGGITSHSDLVPNEAQVQGAIDAFQGEIAQIPPMYSAKKVGGKKLYTLARQGVTIEREPVRVRVEIQLLGYAYPFLHIEARCSKGTYIRTLAHDIGQLLGCGAYLQELQRIRSGDFTLAECVPQALLTHPDFDPLEHLRRC